jgi:hypothetical protein
LCPLCQKAFSEYPFDLFPLNHIPAVASVGSCKIRCGGDLGSQFAFIRVISGKARDCPDFVDQAGKMVESRRLLSGKIGLPLALREPPGALQRLALTALSTVLGATAHATVPR